MGQHPEEDLPASSGLRVKITPAVNKTDSVRRGGRKFIARSGGKMSPCHLALCPSAA